jgi:hypothetical protein
VSGGIDEIDFLIAPESRDRGALNRDAALLFLLQIVGGGRSLQILRVVNIDDGVLTPRVVQDALRRRRLAGVDVGNDADIADIGKGCCTSHSENSVKVLGGHKGRVKSRVVCHGDERLSKKQRKAPDP